MNTKRLLELAAILDRQLTVPIGAESGFNMLRVAHNCGTPSCISGFAEAAFGVESSSPVHLRNIDFAIDTEKLLGLTVKQFYELCYPKAAPAWSATARQAAKVIRHLVETGEVDWGVIL